MKGRAFMKKNYSKFYASSDLATRWGESRQTIYAWKKRYDDFPKPYMYVNNGRTPIYAEEDILIYEQKRGLNKKSS